MSKRRSSASQSAGRSSSGRASLVEGGSSTPSVVVSVDSVAASEDVANVGKVDSRDGAVSFPRGAVSSVGGSTPDSD